MSRRTKVVGGLLILIGLPALVAFAEAITFSVRNRSNGVMVSSGVKREYLLYVPSGYDRTRPTPLVISLHGAGGWPVQQKDLSGWNRVAEKEKFIVVYPAGMDGSGPRVWAVNRGPGLQRDVRFISELIGKLETEYNIDPDRIYANGISNGGGMTFVLSCTLSNRIAAFGMVGAAQSLPWKWCTDQRAVPMIDFHGTADRMAPFNGGTSWVSEQAFPDVGRWAANWARRNRCASRPMESRIAVDATRREYTGCADDAAVTLYILHSGGHTWPGGQHLPEWFVGPTSESIDASSEMWKFFSRHPLRRR